MFSWVRTCSSTKIKSVALKLIGPNYLESIHNDHYAIRKITFENYCQYNKINPIAEIKAIIQCLAYHLPAV